MKFLIITHVLHKQKDNRWFAYAPYVNEMNLWLKYVDEVEILAPSLINKPTTIESSYRHDKIKFTKIPPIAFISFKMVLYSMLRLPLIFFKIFKACRKTDHIHLRCPGNIGLIGCFVQVFFSKKIKTAKYAGNWDPKAKQPLSYKLQKIILSNTLLTKNIQVLVYGHWKDQTKNIKPFFTATYKKSEIEKPIKRDYLGELKFIFVGSLAEGKRPLFAVKIVEKLYKQGKNVSLNVYGDGILKEVLEDYIVTNELERVIVLHGNQSKEIIKDELKKTHFLILPSKSEGWPKVIAEAMFFGVIPIATKVSCVPNMLDHGNRGVLIQPELYGDVAIINKVLDDILLLEAMSQKASDWSQSYTLDVFEEEISKLLIHS
tara:strand:+ start:72165 stop:73286 length:1122 start_codon:yes stop_codon:yes gene_type:complete